MNRKIYQLVAVILLGCIPSILFSQTVDQIIAKHVAAHGGAERWNKVEALKITGKFTSFSLEHDYTCYKTKSGGYYANFYIGEIPIVESFDGKTGWTIDPWQEINYARDVNSGEVNVFLQNAGFFTPFYDYKTQGNTVEYIGKDTIDNIELYKLNLTRTNGKTETWYLNTKTYLEYKCTSDWIDFAQTLPSEVFFDDFRTVDGLVLPFYTERTFGQRDRILQIENVEINPTIDKNLFTMPRRDEMKKLEFMQGEWNVKVEAFTRRGTWYNLGNTTSSVQFASTNLLQENITYERIFRFTKMLNYAYNDAGKNYRVSMYDDLSTSITMYEGQLNDTAFVFDDTQISYGTDQPMDEHTQYTIHSKSNNGFILERKNSTDNGATWNPKDRFTYTRKNE